MDRTFLLPAVSSLAMCVTACSNKGAIIGEWTVTSYTYDGSVYRLPYTYTEVFDGVTYTYTYGTRLVVDDDDRAAFGGYYTYTSSEGAFEHYEYLYAGSWEKKGREFLFDFDEMRLDMSCTLDGKDALSCDGRSDGDPVLLDLEPFVEDE